MTFIYLYIVIISFLRNFFFNLVFMLVLDVEYLNLAKLVRTNIITFYMSDIFIHSTIKEAL